MKKQFLLICSLLSFSFGAFSVPRWWLKQRRKTLESEIEILSGNSDHIGYWKNQRAWERFLFDHSKLTTEHCSGYDRRQLREKGRYIAANYFVGGITKFGGTLSVAVSHHLELLYKKRDALASKALWKNTKTADGFDNVATALGKQIVMFTNMLKKHSSVVKRRKTAESELEKIVSQLELT